MYSTMQNILLQKSTKLKKEARKSLRERKEGFQSRVQANMTLISAQWCDSIQNLHHNVIALLQQHHVVLHVV